MRILVNKLKYTYKKFMFEIGIVALGISNIIIDFCTYSNFIYSNGTFVTTLKAPNVLAKSSC